MSNKGSHPTSSAKGVARRLSLVAVLLVGVSSIAYVLYGSPGEILAWIQELDVETLHATIQGYGAWAPLASVGLMIIHSFLPFPLEILAMANGLVFGLWGGIYLTWVSMVLASWVGYAAARLARPLVLRLVSEERLARVEGWAADRSALELIAVRLVPVFSFNLLNLGLGLLRVPLWRYTWTTAVGIIPNVVLAVLAGQLLAVGPWAWAIIGGVIVAFGAYYYTRWRRRKHEKGSTPPA